MTTITKKIEFVTRNRRKCLAGPPEPKPPAPQTRVPRVSKLMALAIRFDRMLREGVVVDLSELARLASVTQPRMTQIMNLNHLAAGIQEALLFLPPAPHGRDPIHERMLRPLAAEPNWYLQEVMWQRILIHHHLSLCRA